MEAHYYNTDIRWEDNQRGIICSPELNKRRGICIEVATPRVFPDGKAGIWSPEHLFVAAVSSCLMTTFLAIAENSTLEFLSFSCESKGKMELQNGKLIMSEIDLCPSVVISNESQRDKTIRIVKKAENACLISRSIKSKVSMEIVVEVKKALIES